jgi:hypothetical protein
MKSLPPLEFSTTGYKLDHGRAKLQTAAAGDKQNEYKLISIPRTAELIAETPDSSRQWYVRDPPLFWP